MVEDVAAPQPGHRLQILVVDDNRDAADTLCIVLKLWGYDARAVYDGEAALEAARDFAPHCLVLDIGLPIVDGYRVAERVRQLPGMEKTKLIALTAYSDEAHLRRAKEAGFDHHLVKPPDLAELERILTMLQEMIRLASKTEELARQSVDLATQTQEMIQEVREDLQEVKQELREVKEELREMKGENGESAGPEAPPG